MIIEQSRNKALPEGYFAGTTIEPASIVWLRIDDGHLKANLHIGPVTLHLVALEVSDPPDCTALVCQNSGYDLDAIWLAFAMDGPAETLEIDGKPHLIFAFPYNI